MLLYCKKSDKNRICGNSYQWVLGCPKALLAARRFLLVSELTHFSFLKISDKLATVLLRFSWSWPGFCSLSICIYYVCETCGNIKNATIPTHPHKKMTWARLPTWGLPKSGSRWSKCCCRKRPYNSGIVLEEPFVAHLVKSCDSFAGFSDIIYKFLL